MICERRSSPYLSTIAVSSSETICRCRSGLSRMSCEVGDDELELGELVDDLLPLQGREPAQLHVEDRGRLELVDVEQRHQALRGPRRRPGCARISAMTSSSVSSALTRPRKMCASLLGLAQPVAGPPLDDLDLVGHPVRHELVEGQRARHAVDEREHVAGEVRLQLGVLEQVVEHHPRDRVALEHDDQLLAGARRGVVLDVGDALDLAGVGELGDLHRQVVGVDLVGQLGDDQRGAAPGCPRRCRRRRASSPSRGRCGRPARCRAGRRSAPWSGSPGP